MRIRKAIEQDLDSLLKLRLENAKYHSESVVQKPLKIDFYDFFMKHTMECLADRDCQVFIAYDNSETVGYIIGFINKNHPIFDLGKEALIDDFYVKSSHRTKGYGSKLYDNMIEWFKSNSIERINLNVYLNNSSGNDFWEKENFTTQFYRKSKGF
tara:strand:+ start:252 stop:716 length:465 start_codon:yes stop_codon:yes gene_type:complete